MINWYRMYLDTRGAAARSAECVSGMAGRKSCPGYARAVAQRLFFQNRGLYENSDYQTR